ncbi:dethiobiotin synthetase [Chromohalobacter marismortui]|uniref:ATP-dependent dethiobiotin synthetase BioD n=1 Tax=Chromohalobacter marismortui TaxID=42055 RepID=A0A4R7NUA0_9GAMM|nr:MULTISPECIES: dethiobiotin synthase [Chromohalobacter]MCI0510738.1 dethiobiotin synthase [Chromohalobacter sp.]MCI0594776.1 dethiobiotin synthase [Chromohalobacter sp.]TDU24685.1 dethiobiotin synthetase [Chromohalobacter marismortui]
MTAYFVTGTDTDAGKTLVAGGLLALARRHGLTTLGLKPVASGCEPTVGALRNIDALTLQAQSMPTTAYATINPYAYAPAIAPHLAARRAGRIPTLDALVAHVAGPLAETRDLTLIEGAGGWRVPLNDDEDLAGLAVCLELPVILVVGLQLGCLNHARLSTEAIRADGLHVAGWVGNLIDPAFSSDDACYRDNLATLERTLEAPCLGIVPRLAAETPDARAVAAADYLTLPTYEESR